MASEREFRAGERFLATVQNGLAGDVPDRLGLRKYSTSLGMNICFNCYDERGNYYNEISLTGGSTIRQFIGKRISYEFYRKNDVCGFIKLPLGEGIRMMYDYLVIRLRKEHAADSRPVRFFEMGVVTVCEALSLKDKV